MKKITDILAGFLAVALVLTAGFSATPALAAANVTDGGLGVLAVSNFTRHPNSNTNWSLSTTADAGDIVSFGIYYQNEGPDIARDVRVQLSQPGSNARTSHTLGGSVFGDNIGQINGNATVNLSSSQTLTFNGTVNWDRNTTGTGSALPNGSGVFNSTGVSLGDIAPGEYGTVVVRFVVGNDNGGVVPPTQQNPVVSTLSAQVNGQNSATLNGQVDFRGTSRNANCYFEYGPNNSLGFVSSGTSITSSSVQNFSATVNGLSANTTYWYRAVCQTAGSTFSGSILSFTTQGASNPVNDPTVSTLNASVFNQNSAQVNGRIDFNGTFQSGSCYFEYGPNNSLGFTSGSQGVSGSASQNFSSTLNGLNSNTTYWYRAVCNTNGRIFTGAILNFTTGGFQNNTVDPIVTTGSATFVSSNTAQVNGTIDFRGTFATGVCFFEYGTNGFLGSISGTQNVSGSNFQSFSATLNNLVPGAQYFYRANCQVNGRNFTGSTLTFTAQGNNIINPQVLTVNTNPATEIFAQSARLNGSVFSAGQAQNVSAWFEYGRSTGLGNQTAVGNLGSLTSATFTNVLLNLSPNTTYYFRAVAQNQFGQIARGAILSFTTPGAQVVVPPRVVPPPVYVAPAASPIVISYGLDNVHPLPGDVVLYRVGWLNQGPHRLTNAILRVTLPPGLTYLDSKQGIARDGASLIYPVGNIAVGGSGAITFRALIDRSVPIGTDLPMSIRMDFYNPVTAKNGDVTITGFTHVAPDNYPVFINNPAQPSPVTVVTIATTTPAAPIVVNNDSALLGNLNASFFPQTAAGWLLLLILAVLIVALIRRAFMTAPRA